MSALSALGGKQDLIDKVCVARDEKVGVYGFVFHRGRSIESRQWGQMLTQDRWRMVSDNN